MKRSTNLAANPDRKQKREPIDRKTALAFVRTGDLDTQKFAEIFGEHPSHVVLNEQRPREFDIAPGGDSARRPSWWGPARR